jgi:hypothetical protein
MSMFSRYGGKVPFQNELDEYYSSVDTVFASSLSNQRRHFVHSFRVVVQGNPEFTNIGNHSEIDNTQCTNDTWRISN